MVGWHQRLNGHKFEQALGDSNEQGSLARCSPWGHEELDMTEHNNFTMTCSSWAACTAQLIASMSKHKPLCHNKAIFHERAEIGDRTNK